MRILFLVTGIGLGHSVREHSIINKIVEKKPDVQIKILGFGNSYDYFKKLGYDVEKILGRYFYGNHLKINKRKIFFRNILYPFIFVSNLFKTLKIIRKFNPDVVVCDAEVEGTIAGKILKKQVVFVYNLYLKKELKGAYGGFMNHFIKFFYKFVDKIINPSLIRNKLIKEDKVYRTPPIVREKMVNLSTEDVLMKKLGFEKKPIIVQIGGSRFGSELVDNIVKVSQEFPDEQFLIFGYRKRRVGNVKFLPFKSNFLEYLKVSKCVISLAGHEILSEIIHFRKASLIFPINYIEQIENARVMRKNKLALVGTYNQIDVDDLKLLLQKLLDKKRGFEKNILELGIKDNGAEVAADLILKR